MAKVLTANLTEAALDWAVAVSRRLPVKRDPMDFKSGSEAGYWIWDDGPGTGTGPVGFRGLIGREYSPRKNWEQGGPIIELEIDNYQKRDGYFYCNRNSRVINFELRRAVWATGPTLLIAAARCYVTGLMGAEIDVPDELLQQVQVADRTEAQEESELPKPPPSSAESPISGYQQIFSEATGITDRAKLAEIEDVVRNDIFHSTLDWQTKEQLQVAAREAVVILDQIAADDNPPAPGAIQ